ncbi:MAG: hypothetical protein Q9226_009367, partial [Calogaya cf. arnoldii]
MRSPTALKCLLSSFIVTVFVSQTIAYDYEPGDTLDRTFCYCTADPENNDQADFDPFTFLSTTDDRSMSYIYNFEYYNFRMNQRLVLECEGHCDSKEDGGYFHNDCLAWQEQNFKCCGYFPLDPDAALGNFDRPQDGLTSKGPEVLSYEFCYDMGGDTLEGKEKDWFRFDDGKR